jgi:hypothetical protein
MEKLDDGVVHRGEQVHLPAVWSASGAEQRLAVDRDRPSPPVVMVAAGTAGQPGANHGGQRLGVKPGKRPADGGLGRDRSIRFHSSRHKTP